LSLSKKNVESFIGEFDDNNDLLKLPQLFKKVSPEVLNDYAHTNLFQTRLGKGLPPVVDAFNIYEAVYQNRLKQRILSLNTITSESDLIDSHIPNDILIVGTYLFQKTQDLGYLNRTYSVINGMTSGGVSYWANARALMRRNGDFRDDILEEQRLVAAVRKTGDDDTLREIYDRQSALEAFRKNTEDKHGDFYESIAESYAIDLEELQEKMQRDTAACLNFFLDAQILYRLYVSPDTIDIFPIDDNARVRVLKLTKQLAATVESGKSAKEMEAASRELYGHLFDGIKGDLPPRLHIIANGTLLDIPFSVLRKDTVGESPRYLGVAHAISRQFSLSTMLLLEDTELKPSYGQPLAMAPSFANEFLQASELRQAGFQLPPLVYNTEELRDLQARGGGEYLYEEDATIGRYRDRAPDYGIIHLATHAISSEVDGLRSRVYLLDDAGEPVGLYAGDIGEQTLNSEMVVLSACETGGGGRNYVEGRVGLTKAYLAAGARSVVASNWAVDDHATAEQMKTFYDGIEAGWPPHVALQASRRAYLEAHPDAAPFKWAAFEAYGGMGPVQWDKSSGIGRWWWLALPLLGVGATVVWNKRRRASRAA
jgi:CHAT domain-containing protein